MRRFIYPPKLFLLGIGLISATVVFAQESATPPTVKPQRTEAPPSVAVENKNKGVLIEVNEDYKIGSGDVLDIQIEDAPELSRQYRVNAAGTMQIPYIGTLNCLAATPETLAKTIEKSLKENEYLKNPNVTVTVRQYNSQTFFVHGEVRQPGVYQVEGRPSVLKLLSLAGGLTEKHGTAIFLLQPEIKPVAPAENSASLATANLNTLQQGRKISSVEKISDEAETNADYDLVRINISDLLKGDPKNNPRVTTGAVIYIPESDIFFVGGEVVAPGSFQLKEGTTLRQAISLAKGLTPKAVPGKAIIFREGGTGNNRLEIKANINEIMNGKQPDIALQANDVIVLPSSRTKTITSGFMNAVPSAAAVALGQLPYILLR